MSLYNRKKREKRKNVFLYVQELEVKAKREMAIVH